MRAGSFPFTHLIAAGLIGLGMASFIVAKFAEDKQRERFTTESILLDLPGADNPQPLLNVGADLTPITPIADGAAAGTADTATLAATPSTTVDSTPELPASKVDTGLIRKHTQVRPGDSLARLFNQHGIPARELQRVLASNPLGPRLKSIFPGHDLTFLLAGDGSLAKLEYSPGPLETLEFRRVGDTFVGREVIQKPERTTAYKHGIIDHSLFVASQRAGLDDSLTMRLAQIFQWDIDFVLDIRAGDEFYVLFEELYLGDKFVGHGDILAAEFVNQRQSYRAIRYADSRGDPDYFTPDGKSMRKAFLRAPVEFSRISSNFNLARKHPLFNRSMPHRGIDYAAPSGTPILAAGDGKILQASRSKPNGNFIVLQHGEQFVTKYLHLSKFGKGARSGGRVKQGQVIGYVGATGWATGPHLHYEFLVNGVHKNPRTVKLPDAAPVRSEERQRFSEKTAPLLALLDNYKQQIQLALAQ